MKKNHIGNLNKTQCFGCTACEYTCPFGAIIMERDQEGFSTGERTTGFSRMS